MDIVKIKFGSHLYGTQTEKSDIDYKGIYIPSYRQIILNNAKETISNKTIKKEGEKNLPGQIDEEIFSLKRYLTLLSEGQTVALDMLFAPINSCEIWSTYWQYIQNNKMKLLSKKSAAFVGYCRTQANKYGIKGSRVACIRNALTLCKNSSQNDILLSIWDEILYLCVNDPHMKIVNITQENKDIIPYWEVCGRKFGSTTLIKYVTECLQKIMDNYGKRSLLAEQQNGIDWKALSHAVRVATQAIELFKTGNIIFPLINAKHILDIKLGKIAYQEVAAEIEFLLELINIESEKSSLPENPDYEFIDDLIFNLYTKSICFENFL